MARRMELHRGWRGFLSRRRRDPAARSARPGHPTCCCAARGLLSVPASRIFQFAFFNLQFEILSPPTPPAPPLRRGGETRCCAARFAYIGKASRFACAALRFLSVPARRIFQFAFVNLRFEILSRSTPPTAPYEGGEASLSSVPARRDRVPLWLLFARCFV